MSFEPREYLRHILAETDYLLETAGEVTAVQFASDTTLQRPLYIVSNGGP